MLFTNGHLQNPNVFFAHPHHAQTATQADGNSNDHIPPLPGPYDGPALWTSRRLLRAATKPPEEARLRAAAASLPRPRRTDSSDDLCDHFDECLFIRKCHC